MAVKFEINEKGKAEMLAQPSVTAFLRTLAQAAVEQARSLAPVDTGTYRDSLTTFERPGPGGTTVVGFGTASPIWHLVEFGGPHNAPHRVLAAALQAVSSRVELI